MFSVLSFIYFYFFISSSRFCVDVECRLDFTLTYSSSSVQQFVCKRTIRVERL